MTAVTPTIAIEPPLRLVALDESGGSLEGLVRMMLSRKGQSDQLVRGVVQFLVQEGQRFAETPSGRRWQAVLAESALVSNGWLLWNMLDLDRYTTERDLHPGGDTPAAMIEDVVRELSALRMDEIVQLVRNLSLEEQEQPA
ncbi:hypothetical protein [Sphingomonas arenae]|uniref:hypothetical protein n=1 Tax=Sphingomonas arenae TaxID=2812555 RepID=UPI00196744E3|nr:hypothetical protein [Sphingomonas arenae]